MGDKLCMEMIRGYELHGKDRSRVTEKSGGVAGSISEEGSQSECI